MAVYTFKCECKGEYDVLMKPSELPLKNCPHCGKENPERVWCPNIIGSFPQGGACKTESYWDKNRKGL